MELLDEKTQRRMKIAKCLEYAAPLKAELVELIDCSKANLEDMCISKIDDKKLAELNMKIGERLGLEKAMSILEGFELELLEAKKDLVANSPRGR